MAFWSTDCKQVLPLRRLANTFLLFALFALSDVALATESSMPVRSGQHDSIAADSRIVLRYRGRNSQIQVVRPGKRNAAEVLQQLKTQSDVEFVAIDQRRRRHSIPNDSLFADQWYLQNTQPAAIGASTAWDTTTGSAGTIVAVLDTGVRFDHPDLARASSAGKLLPGYDFIAADPGSATRFLTANDGDGRDADPTDPGDWIDSNDRQQAQFDDCDIENSSWHGTRVSGLIAAASNNSIGIAGAAWQTWILPVRVLGKCGGYDSDILDAMRWAAGLPVAGIPVNPYPAQIINLSLGSEDACSAPYIDVIEELTQHGVVVVASAGNGGGPVESPANCPGVIAVAGLRHAGTKVGYSSLGPEITIAAPAGNCVNTSGACLFSLTTTFDIGRTVPAGSGYTDQFSTNLGTSFSAPLVAGVGALMHSVNARLAPQHMIARLRESARNFPDGGPTPPPTCHVPVDANDTQLAECVCTTSTCGAGMLSAPNAVIAAQRPITSILAPTNVTAGAVLSIDGSSSSAACGRSIAAYRWEVISAPGTSVPLPSNPNQAITEIAAPISGSYTLRLTITDDRGSVDSGDLFIASTAATTLTTPPLPGSACPIVVSVSQGPPTPTQPTTAPAPSKSGGGGGSIGYGLVLVLLLVAGYREPGTRPSSSCRSS